MSFPWATRFSSRSALGPPHDGVRRARRPNLFRDLQGSRPLAPASKRDRLAHRPHGDDLFRWCGFLHGSWFASSGRSTCDCLDGRSNVVFLAKAELGIVDPHAMQDRRELAGDRDASSRHPAMFGDLHAPCSQGRPFLAANEQRVGGFVERRAHQFIATSADVPLYIRFT